MQAGDVLRSLALIGFGAAAAAAGFFAGGSGAPSGDSRTANHVKLLSSKLEEIVEAVRSMQIEHDHGPVAQIDPSSVQPIRTEDSPGQLALAIQELREAIRRLPHGCATNLDSGPGGIEKRGAALSEVRALDDGDSRRLRQRHFCFTKSQIYEAYGMPDMVEGGPGASIWRYRPDAGSGWIVFTFIDGVVHDVSQPFKDS